MPRTRVIIYREDDGTVPLVEWLDSLEDKAKDKCFVRMERLAELGHELRRREADLLRDGIYELRTQWGRVQYRILYFFHGGGAVVLSHGLTKERVVPPGEIDRALERRARFLKDPARHSLEDLG